MMDPSVARQLLSNGIAELMVGMCALGDATPEAFEALRENAIRAVDELRDILRENAAAWELDDARYAAALPHAAALVAALRNVSVELPLSPDVEQTFDAFLAALAVRPEPSLRSLLVAYRAADGEA